MELQNIKGIGERTTKILEKLNIKTEEDLVTYYPFRYDIIKKTDIRNMQNEDKVIIDGQVETIPNVYFFSRKKDKMTFKLNTNDKLLNIIIFNRGFLKTKFSPKNNSTNNNWCSNRIL